MNKSALKNGMHVKLRDGSIREYYKGYFIGVEYNGLGYIDFYDIDLKHDIESKLDIMEVFDEDNNTIWERGKEVDWDKVPVGTKVLVKSDYDDEYKEEIFLCSNGYGDYLTYNRTVGLQRWNYCKLAEQAKEEVTFYDIEKGMNKFPVLDISKISLATEVDKLTEETHEFINAIANNDEENMIEEFFDVIQVMINILGRYELTDKLEDGLQDHIEKLARRGWNIEIWL